MSEMVAWVSGLLPAGEPITVGALQAAFESLAANELGRGYVLSDPQIYGSEAFVLEVFGEGAEKGKVKGVGEVWVTDKLDPVRDLQAVWTRTEATVPEPKRRQRTRRR